MTKSRQYLFYLRLKARAHFLFASCTEANKKDSVLQNNCWSKVQFYCNEQLITGKSVSIT